MAGWLIPLFRVVLVTLVALTMLAAPTQAHCHDVCTAAVPDQGVVESLAGVGPAIALVGAAVVFAARRAFVR